MKLRNWAVGAVTAMLGLGLIGVGANAAFTTTTVSSQRITAGTLSLILHATGAGNNTTRSITLPSFGPTNVGSTFSTGTEGVTIKNVGTVAATEVKSKAGVTYTVSSPADTALAVQAYVCIGNSTLVFYNGPLFGAPTTTIAGSIPAGGTSFYVVNVYAGTEHTWCGSVGAGGTPPPGGGTSSAPALNNTAQGGTVNMTETLTYQG